jgi:hypothetical protein
VESVKGLVDLRPRDSLPTHPRLDRPALHAEQLTHLFTRESCFDADLIEELHKQVSLIRRGSTYLDVGLL